MRHQWKVGDRFMVVDMSESSIGWNTEEVHRFLGGEGCIGEVVTDSIKIKMLSGPAAGKTSYPRMSRLKPITQCLTE